MITERRRLTYTAIAVTVVAVVTGLILGAAFFPGDAAPSAADTSPTSLSHDGGGELFSANCTGCHGSSREGVAGGAPPLTQASLAHLSDTEVRDTISHGRPTAGMPSFEGTLTVAEIDALLEFIRSAAP